MCRVLPCCCCCSLCCLFVGIGAAVTAAAAAAGMTGSGVLEGTIHERSTGPENPTAATLSGPASSGVNAACPHPRYFCSVVLDQTGVGSGGEGTSPDLSLSYLAAKAIVHERSPWRDEGHKKDSNQVVYDGGLQNVRCVTRA